MKVDRVQNASYAKQTFKYTGNNSCVNFGMMSPPTKTLKDWENVTKEMSEVTRKVLKKLGEIFKK